MTEGEQFLEVIAREEAERRFRSAVPWQPLDREVVPLSEAWGRVLAEDVLAPRDLPGFDRANVDGYAVHSADTVGASEQTPVRLQGMGSPIEAGQWVQDAVPPGCARSIATGGMLPRSADAVVMLEHTTREGDTVWVRRAIPPGSGLTFAGTDITQGETLFRQGTRLTSRETGVLAAVGLSHVPVIRRPRVAILSTGNELLSPGEPWRPGCVYDSNSRVLIDAVHELGGLPIPLGVVPDEVTAMRGALHQALQLADLVLLSGGTSKGRGDVSYRVVGELTDPGIIVHGVALKPGKPLCLAVTQGKPVVVLPGFPTSAIFTFQEFVAPLLRAWLAQPTETLRASAQTLSARLATRWKSEIGRTEYLLVALLPTDSDWLAFPLGQGSGSVTAFARADGFLVIPRYTEQLEAGETVTVHLLGKDLQLADLVVMGSHCVGVDLLLSELQRRGVRSKALYVGSWGGLQAVQHGWCDVAGMHLFHAETNSYNVRYLTPRERWVPGYRRVQGLAFRRDDGRLTGRSWDELLPLLRGERPCEPPLVMVNRNAGSGTRLLIDRLLQGARPAGYAVQPTQHQAVAAAIAQRRADWGLTLERVAAYYDLGFLPLQEECFDFAIPQARWSRPAVQKFLEVLHDPAVQEQLRQWGFTPATPS
ncbi:MAG: molybdopterin biosynthesis protein [Planctomycetaceae bacterium]|nr:MAG: molybdopterin biosynthesis protein [Planctomycetaceae bacterium]